MGGAGAGADHLGSVADLRFRDGGTRCRARHRRRSSRLGRHGAVVLLRPAAAAVPDHAGGSEAPLADHRRVDRGRAPSFLAGFGATLLVVLVNTRLSWDSGSVALAAWAICARIQTFIQMPQLGISQGLQPIVGFNAGRRLRTRVLRARNLSLSATVIYGVLVVILAGPLVAVFVGEDETVAATARQALRIIASGFTVAGIAPLVSAYCQSLGRPAPSYLISVGTLLVLKVPLLLVLSTPRPDRCLARADRRRTGRGSSRAHRAPGHPPGPGVVRGRLGIRGTWPSPVRFRAEDSPRGLWRSLGKRVGFTPSRVRIPHPPPTELR